MSSSADRPAGMTIRRPPFSSGPQISNVAASNDAGAMCRNTSSSGPNQHSVFPGPGGLLPGCGTQTPFGVPVEPDVNIT